ncbi:MAG: M48 family peptidase [Actinobacteria bacterium]|nr:M48 family peptidase [Actinomycetota bacterium]
MARSTEAAVAQLAASLGIPQVELRRSQRRRRSVSAFREEGVVIISAPVRISQTELLELAEQLLTKIAKDSQGSRTSDEDLMSRALDLVRRWFGEGFPKPASVRWTSQQSRVWGTCTTADLTIRLSDRLQGMPDFVVDYVLVHELAHLRYPDHGEQFEALVSRYPHTSKARGFLEGVTWQWQRGRPDSGIATQLGLFDDVV